VDFSPDGRLLAIAASDESEQVSSISLWDAENPHQIRSLTGHKGRCFCVRFSPDGQFLASTEGGMIVNLWEVASGRIVRTLKQGLLRKAFDGKFRCPIAFSPNGRHLATRSWPITIWDIFTGQQVAAFAPDPMTLTTAVFLGFTWDGQSLIEVRGNGTIRVWNVPTEKVANVLIDPPKRQGVTEAVHTAALSRDGRTLAVSKYSSADDPKFNVTLWDVPRGRPIGTLTPTESSEALAFSPDGEWLAYTDTIYGNGQATGLIKFCRISSDS
jgi:WD40 repeat protein